MAITLDGTNGITTPAIDLTVTPLPVDDGGTGITSFGSGIATFLQTPSSANLASAITNETGSGSLVFGTSPTLTTPTIDSAQVPTISGTAPLYLCRAWVNFNGTGTVASRASGNVTSITDNGVGNYTVNFTTAMPDANYSWSSNVWGYECSPPDSGTPITTSSLQINTYYVAGTTGQRTSWDAQYASVSIFR